MHMHLFLQASKTSYWKEHNKHLNVYYKCNKFILEFEMGIHY